jgi:hypothetical protein
MVALLLLLAAALSVAAEQTVERQPVLTIKSPDIDGGLLAGISWDSGALFLQGVVANPDGTLSGRFLVIPAQSTTLTHRKDQTEASIQYWEKKAKRTSPTGLGSITTVVDSKMPMYGVSSQAARIGNAVDMGGMRKKYTVRLGRLTLHEREDGREPYDGEFWSWSPAELNRIAYVDGNGDLWVARADGTNPRRLLKGDFTLPAWSDDGKAIAIAEKKDSGRRWDISLVLLPAELRSAR